MSSSFFVRTDEQTLILETYWSNPVSLALAFITNLTSMFDADSRQLFSDASAKASKDKHGVVCEHLSVIGLESEFTCYLYHDSRRLWVLGIEDTGQADKESKNMYNKVCLNLIRSFSDMFEHRQMINSQEVSNHFEQIQRLNNELVNTHRDLQRANRQLEVLNKELNNRLVKDPLTGLVSRYQYRSEIDRVIKKHPDAQGVFAFIDIDNFKSVNDTFGHQVGDEYLVEFSKRISVLDFGMPGIFMRIAGDEFGIYLHGIDSFPIDFGEMFWKLFQLGVTKQPVATAAGQLPLSCSVGLAVYNRDTTNVYELIEYADWAMYLAKQNGKNGYRFFDKHVYEQRFLKQTSFSTLR